MARIWILGLFFICSCVSETPSSPVTGNVLRFDPLVVSTEDNERIQAICSSLRAKEELLDVLITTGSSYTFSYSQKNCEDQQLPAPKSIVTKIKKIDSDYIFKTEDNTDFPFSEVETASKGIMSEICNAPEGQLMNPMQTSGSAAIWFTTFTSSEHCQSDENGVCIHIQKGTVLEDLNYKINTNEWIKFKINNSRRGFFTERKIISSATCEGNGSIEMKATLK